MSFWIKVDVLESGDVNVTTYDRDITGSPRNPIRHRCASTVSQALRLLAAAMVTATAEKLKEQP